MAQKVAQWLRQTVVTISLMVTLRAVLSAMATQPKSDLTAPLVGGRDPVDEETEMVQTKLLRCKQCNALFCDGFGTSRSCWPCVSKSMQGLIEGFQAQQRWKDLMAESEWRPMISNDRDIKYKGEVSKKKVWTSSGAASWSSSGAASSSSSGAAPHLLLAEDTAGAGSMPKPLLPVSRPVLAVIRRNPPCPCGCKLKRFKQSR